MELEKILLLGEKTEKEKLMDMTVPELKAMATDLLDLAFPKHTKKQEMVDTILKEIDK